MIERILDLFDEYGFKAWPQVEPAHADMITLIDFGLNQYKHHVSVIELGVDVERHKSDDAPRGTPITDEETAARVSAVRAHNPNFKSFLKHSEIEYMPPTYREGIVFIDDRQGYESLNEIGNKFAAWDAQFAPTPVGLQYGYLTDKIWWQELQDPPAEIGRALPEETPNTVALFWADFT